jgi:hypothetical protein
MEALCLRMFLLPSLRQLIDSPYINHVREEMGGRSSTSLIGLPILGTPCCRADSSRRWMRKKPKDFVPGVRC